MSDDPESAKDVAVVVQVLQEALTVMDNPDPDRNPARWLVGCRKCPWFGERGRSCRRASLVLARPQRNLPRCDQGIGNMRHEFAATDRNAKRRKNAGGRLAKGAPDRLQAFTLFPALPKLRALSCCKPNPMILSLHRHRSTSSV